MPWFRYGDSLAVPESRLLVICDALHVTYDPNWRQRWAGYTNITGATVNAARNTIKPEKRRTDEPGFWNGLSRKDDFLATLELLGSSVPKPLRRILRYRTGSVGRSEERAGLEISTENPPRPKAGRPCRREGEEDREMRRRRGGVRKESLDRSQPHRPWECSTTSQ